MAVPAQLVTRGSRSIRPKKKAEPDSSLLSDLGRGTLGTLQFIGETTNKLSRAGWGSANYLAGGKSGGGLLNLVPFSDMMGLTDPREGIEASQFLENRGVLPKNTPGFDRWDIPRLAIDIAGDPLSYASGVGLLKSLGKGGHVLSKAGPEAAKLSRVARMTTKVSELASKLPAEALQTAVKRSGFSSTAEFLSKHGDEAVGGLVSLTKGPLGAPIKALGTGKLAQKVGGTLDKLGDVARYGKIPGTEFSPGQQLSRVFSSDAMGLHTPTIAKAAKDLPDAREAIIQGHRGTVAKDVSELARSGALDDETSMFGRAYGEDVLDISKLPAEQQAKAQLAAKITKPWKQKLDQSFIRARELGIRVERHGDPSGGGYLPRFFVDKLHNAANTMGREDYLIGIKGMTEALRKAIADPKVLEGEFDDAVDYVRQTYPSVVEMPKAEVLRQGGNVIGSTIDSAKWEAGLQQARQNAEDLVHHIRNVYTPEQRAVGGFGRNWLVDLQDAQIGMDWKATRATAMLDAMKDLAKPTREIATQGETRTVAEVLEAAGLDGVSNVTRPHPVSGTREEVKAGALRYLADKLGSSKKDADLAALAARRIPAAEADDLVRLMKGDDIKNVVGPLVQLFDAATNFFKVSVLNWPSRYSRDFTSSQAMNILTGNFSPRAATELHKMIAGGVGDFTDIPIVQQMLTEQGLEATAENSTEIMRQLFYTYEKHTAVAGTHGTSEIVGELSGTLPGGTKAFAAEFPGRDPLSPLSPSTLNAGAPLKSLAAWNPLNVRGVGGRLTSGAKLPAIGERLGRYTDTMGRGVAFITNLQRGVAPEQASRIADAIQVNYCVDEHTEILTQRGWLKYDELRIDDLALSIDMDTEDITWSPVRAVNVFGERWRAMHKWSGHGFSALTTGEHRWLSRYGRYRKVGTLTAAGGCNQVGTKRRTWTWRTSAHIAEHACSLILGGGNYRGTATEKHSDEVVELCGWYISEGSDHNNCGISVHQSIKHNPQHVARLRALALYFSSEGSTANEWKPSDNGWGPIAHFYFGLGIGVKVRRELCPNKVPTLEFLSSLTQRQLKLLYDTILDGDADRRWVTRSGRESARIGQSARCRSEAIQIIAAMLGFRTKLSPVNKQGMHKVQVYGSVFACSKAVKREIIEHYGIVWCPTTDNGTWLARRDGCTYWTGNSPRTFTAAERKYLKRLAPFYSFVSRMLPEVTKQLLDRPGGGIAQSIRGANDLRGESTGPVPEYVGKGLAIPLGETPTGDSRYLTALDLMHEAPINMLGVKNGAPDLPGTLRNVGAQLNPYIKGGLELAFNKTLFQNRELEDSDPNIGRLLSNVGLRDEGPDGHPRPFINTTVEQLASNSPAARLLTTLRTATDPRKGLIEKGINLGTGARISDISPAAQDAVLRTQIDEAMRDLGAQSYDVTRFSKAQLSAASPEERQKMLAFNALKDELARRAKSRKQTIETTAKIKPKR